MKYEDLPKHFPEIYAEINSKVEGIFHPSEYESLFKSLNLLTIKTSVISKDIPKESSNFSIGEIPNALHYIWLGSHLPVKYFEDISFFAKQMKETRGITLLWTDQQNVDIELKEWLEQNSIYLIPNFKIRWNSLFNSLA